MVARRSLRDHVRSQLPSVCPRSILPIPRGLGCRPLRRQPLGRGALFGLPAGGRPDRRRASPQPYRLDPPGGRSLVDVIAALFSPLRQRIQRFIDRSFYRSKYDAAKTLQEFGATLRDATDLDGLTEKVTGVIRKTVQPAHVSIWLVPSRGKEGDE